MSATFLFALIHENVDVPEHRKLTDFQNLLWLSRIEEVLKKKLTNSDKVETELLSTFPTFSLFSRTGSLGHSRT